MIKKDLGDKIRRLRKERKITQKQLAAGIETTQDYVSEIENGNVNLTIDYIKKIADFFMVTIEINIK